MFLYDYDKRLVAADAKSVEELGFESVERFFEEVNDLSELFVQKPGYIYQFKNFSWIDFIIFNPAKEHRVKLLPLEVEKNIHVVELTGKDGKNYYIVTFGTSTFEHKSVETPLFDDFQKTEKQEEDEENLQLSSQPEHDFEPTLSPQNDSVSVPKEETVQDTILETTPFALEVEDKEAENDFVTTELPIKEDIEERIELIIEPLVEEEKHVQQEVEEVFKEAESVGEEKIELLTQPPIEREESCVETEIQKEESKEKSYDIAKVAQQLEVDTELVEELLQEFVLQANELRTQIYEAIEKQSLKRAKELIHKIKGASANLRIAVLDDVLASTHGVEDFNRLKEIMDQFYDKLPEFVSKLREEGLEIDTDSLPQESIEKSDADKTEDVLEEVVTRQEFERFEQQEEKEEKSEISKESIVIQAQKELGLEREDIEELIKEYLLRALNSLFVLKRAFIAKNREEIESIVHQLKGSALNLRLTLLSPILDDLKSLEEETLTQFENNIRVLAQMFDIDEVEDVTSRKITEIAHEIGVDEESYKEFVREFLEDVLQLEKDGFPVQDIRKLRSVAKNLRLKPFVLYLESMLEDSKNREAYFRKIVETANMYKEQL